MYKCNSLHKESIGINLSVYLSNTYIDDREDPIILFPNAEL